MSKIYEWFTTKTVVSVFMSSACLATVTLWLQWVGITLHITFVMIPHEVICMPVNKTWANQRWCCRGWHMLAWRGHGEFSISSESDFPPLKDLKSYLLLFVSFWFGCWWCRCVNESATERMMKNESLLVTLDTRASDADVWPRGSSGSPGAYVRPQLLGCFLSTAAKAEPEGDFQCV